MKSLIQVGETTYEEGGDIHRFGDNGTLVVVKTQSEEDFPIEEEDESFEETARHDEYRVFDLSDVPVTTYRKWKENDSVEVGELEQEEIIDLLSDLV